MPRTPYPILIAGLCLLAIAGYSFADTEDTQFLFVQSASTGSFDGTTLTLDGVGTTSYFSDRPKRIVGHLRNEIFVSQWAEGDDSFASNPPNAVLSVLGESGAIDATLELSSPKLDGDQITYQVKLLDGEPPMAFKSATLFIDSKTGAFIGGMVAGHVLDNMSR